MNNDKATIFDKEIYLHLSTSGHYCIEIFPSFIEKELIEEVLILEKDLPRSKKHSQILKLHKQFGHASVQNLQKLLKNANCVENTLTEIIEDVVNNRETCLTFKRPSPRPVVGLPKASEFNDTVSVDLHQLKPNLWYLHIIDEFTRFSNAAIISKKNDFYENIYFKLDRFVWSSHQNFQR